MTGEQTRAAVYARVSTPEQAEGYSIADQVRELSRYAEAQGLQVVEPILDEGHSATDLNRPGLTRILELAAAGSIDAVVAVKRDRLFRSRFHRLMFEQDLQDLGVQLIALNDLNHRLGDAFVDEFAQFEREQLLERTLRGKREKARQGKVSGANVPAYGYRWNDGKDGYLVDPETMPVVHRIFQAVADGDSVYSVIKRLTAEGISPPNSNHKRKAGNWTRAFIRGLINNDLYRPHTYPELQRLVQEGNMTAEVLGRLDPDKMYGISWAGRRQTITTFRGRQKTKRTIQRPRKDWIAVPVPSSGISRAVVDRARERLNDNKAPAKTNSRDFWELSGGVLRCSDCGRSMSTKTDKQKGREYYYYKCHSRYREDGPACNNGRNYRAADLEAQVADWVSELLADQGGLIRAIDAALQMPDTAEKDAAAIRQHLIELQTERSGYIRQNARGILTDAELDAYLAELAQHRAAAEDQLEQLTEGLSRVQRLQQYKAQLLRHYDDWALRGLSPQDRNATYRRLGIQVLIGPDGMTADVAGATVRWQPTIVDLLDGATVTIHGVVPSEGRSSTASVPIGDP
jgi:site-specific DNA recombinase